MKRRKVLILHLLIIIATLFSSVISLFPDQLYDLCYFGEPMKNGEFLFVRYRNPLLDPLLRTFEIHVFNPSTGKITFLQQYGEMSYLLPVVSPDRTTVTYHSLIEGNDYLVTRNIITGKSTRLRFDTSGYFLFNDLHYDNETVASVLKRGPGRQAIYIISNDLGTIRRLYTGAAFQEVGFLYNGSVYYVDHVGNRLSLGVVLSDGSLRTVVEENIEYIAKGPRGDAILFSIENDLFIYRVYNNETIRLTEHFTPGESHPLIAEDGSACVIYDGEVTLLVNIPSGDVLYYLSFRGDDRGDILTRFSYYTVKEDQVYTIKYKKPGQVLVALFSDEGPIHLLAVSPDDRYILYRLEDERELRIYDRRTGERFSKTFPFVIEEVIVSPFMEFTEAMRSIYIIALTGGDTTTGPKENQSSTSEGKETALPVRELYLYNYPRKSLTAVSTAGDTDIRLYLRER
jgi:WD40 repeat protein